MSSHISKQTKLQRKNGISLKKIESKQAQNSFTLMNGLSDAQIHGDANQSLMISFDNTREFYENQIKTSDQLTDQILYLYKDMNKKTIQIVQQMIKEGYSRKCYDNKILSRLKNQKKQMEMSSINKKQNSFSDQNTRYGNQIKNEITINRNANYQQKDDKDEIGIKKTKKRQNDEQVDDIFGAVRLVISPFDENQKKQTQPSNCSEILRMKQRQQRMANHILNQNEKISDLKQKLQNKFKELAKIKTTNNLINAHTSQLWSDNLQLKKQLHILTGQALQYRNKNDQLQNEMGDIKASYELKISSLKLKLQEIQIYRQNLQIERLGDFSINKIFKKNHDNYDSKHQTPNKSFMNIQNSSAQRNYRQENNYLRELLTRELDKNSQIRQKNIKNELKIQKLTQVINKLNNELYKKEMVDSDIQYSYMNVDKMKQSIYLCQDSDKKFQAMKLRAQILQQNHCQDQRKQKSQTDFFDFYGSMQKRLFEK